MNESNQILFKKQEFKRINIQYDLQKPREQIPREKKLR
jgi:hypothetical protein